mgnify:FL=1
MDPKKNIITDISTVIQNLRQQIENLQGTTEELCKSTGNCAHIKKAHKELIPKKKNETDL